MAQALKEFGIKDLAKNALLDSMVASFGVKFPRGMVWYRISIGIGIRIGIDGGSVVVCCMVLQE